jgi:DNA-directed RNA polymerase subunit L
MMKLNIVEDGKKGVVIEFVDVDKGVADLIKAKLMQNKDVDYVGVVKEHFEVSNPKLLIRSGKNAKTLVIKAVEELEDEMKELSSQVPKK